jgi:hypothetical protein
MAVDRIGNTIAAGQVLLLAGRVLFIDGDEITMVIGDNNSLAFKVKAGDVVQVDATTSGGGGAAWGGITGTLSSQTDLQTALNARAPTNNPTFTGIAVFAQAGSNEAPATNLRFARMEELNQSQSAQDALFLFVLAGYAAAVHVHSAADITSGTLPIARGGTGATTQPAALAALGAAEAEHTHDPRNVSVDVSALTGSLSGSGITNVKEFVEWVDANLTP